MVSEEDHLEEDNEEEDWKEERPVYVFVSIHTTVTYHISSRGKVTSRGRVSPDWSTGLLDSPKKRCVLTSVRYQLVLISYIRTGLKAEEIPTPESPSPKYVMSLSPLAYC